jgi:SAM-dependent methyltransferase
MSRLKTMKSIRHQFHGEAGVDNFTKLDGTIVFYSFVKSLYRENLRVLDFGAGRGAWFHKGDSVMKRRLQDLREHGAHVVAVDVDRGVLENRVSHEQVLVQPGEPLPFPDGSFDLVVSDFVFEHIEDPTAVTAEIRRVTKPGGWICVRTVNRWGYVRFASALIPNRLHKKALRHIQPERLGLDIFPTEYKLNTVSSIRRHFPDSEVMFYRTSGEPAYYLNNRIIYFLMLMVHKLLPDVLHTSIAFFIKVPLA